MAATLVVAAVIAAGCSIGTSPSSSPLSAPTGVPAATTASSAPSAVDQLRAGTAFIDTTSFRTDVTVADGQITDESHTDVPHRRADSLILSSGSPAYEIRVIDATFYLKIDVKTPGISNNWMILDPAKIPAGFGFSFVPGQDDPGSSARLINAIVSAQASGPDITGTLDAAKVGTGNGISYRVAPGASFPEGAHSQPFDATLDSQGRLVSFEIPSANGLPAATLRYSEFGAPVSVSPPQGAVPAPDSLYPQLGLH
jgi:hypothetical protein